MNIEIIRNAALELRHILNVKAVVLRLPDFFSISNVSVMVIGLDSEGHTQDWWEPRGFGSQTCMIEDLWENTQHSNLPWYVRHGLRGVLSLPLVYLDAPIGAIECYSGTPHHFSLAETGLVRSYAGMIALLARKAEEFERLKEFSKELTLADNVHQVYDIILDRLQAFLHVDGAVLYPYNAARKSFDHDLTVAIGLGQGLILKQPASLKAKDFFSRVIEKSTYRVEDVSSPKNGLSKKARAALIQAGIYAFTGKAVYVENELAALLFLNYANPHPLTDEEQDILTNYIDFAAYTLKNCMIDEKRARLLGRLERNQEIILNVADQTENLVSVEETAYHILNIARDATGAEIGGIYLRNEGTDTFQAVHTFGSPLKVQPVEIEIDPGCQADWYDMSQAGFLGSENEPAHVPAYPACILPIEPACSTRLPIPIFEGRARRLDGFIELESWRKDAFTRDHKELAEDLSTHIHLVLHYARLYEQEKKRTKQFEILFKTARDIAALRSDREVLQQIVTSLCSALKVDAVTLFPYQMETNSFENPVIGGTFYDRGHALKNKPGDERVGRILKSKETHFSSDLPQDEILVGGFTEREKIRASGYVHLKVGNEVVGVLFVNYRCPHIFSEDEQTLIRLLATIAAIAIANSRQMKSLHGQFGLLEEIFWASQGVDNHLPTNQKLEGLVQRLQDEEAFHMVVVHKYNPITEKLERPLLYGTFEDYTYAAGADHLKGTILEHFLPTGPKSYFASDTASDPLLHGKFIKRERVVSSGVLRLEYQGLPYGLMFVNMRAPWNFPDEQRNRLKEYARQIAQVLYKSWLPHQDPLQLKLVVSTGKEISQTLDLKELLRILVRRLREIFGNDIYPSVLIYNKDREDLEHLQFDELPLYIDQYPESQMRRLSLEDGICGLVARTHEPHNAPDVENDRDYLRMYSKTRSEAAVPILLDGKTLYGVLDIESSQLNQFSPNDVLLMKLIANNAARAIQNALSYQRSEQMQQKLFSLYSSANVLATSIDRTATVEKILEDACNLTGAHTAMILRKQNERLYFAEVFPREKKTILISEVGEYLPMDGREITVKVAMDGKPILAENVQDYSTLFIDGLRKITGSELAVPIRDDGEVVGVLNLEHAEAYGLKREDILLVAALADLSEVASKKAESAQELVKQQLEAEKHRQIFRKDLLHNATMENFNTQIGNIGGRLDNMRDELEFRRKTIDDDLYQYLFNEIEQAYSSYLTIFEDINHIKEPEFDEEEKTILLDDTLREMIHRLQWQDNAISFEIPELDKGVTIHAKPTAVSLLVKILVSNSVKSLRKIDRSKPKTVKISCVQESGKARLVIEDNGQGIPENLIHKLGITKVNKGEGAAGNGIGCFLAYTLVNEMEGTITWENVVSGGAQVQIFIPLAK